jgi:hypothetical protein
MKLTQLYTKETIRDSTGVQLSHFSERKGHLLDLDEASGRVRIGGSGFAQVELVPEGNVAQMTPAPKAATK